MNVTPQDYQQALQNPSLSFFDDDLRRASVELDKLGLPRVRSGNFSSVYKVFIDQSCYAVKCFLNPPDDLQTSYEQRINYLNEMNSEYFMEVQYRLRGISVSGKTCPILTMPWQDGMFLDKYIEGCVSRGDKPGIIDIRGQFLSLYRTLRLNHIAHGDLQHGNIVVTPKGGIRLIDYDALFVPTMPPGYCHESGHPNYQHPKRKLLCEFRESTDSFSALVIFTALTILASEPGYWSKYYNGDNLLFCGKDFLNTNQSPLFRALGVFNGERSSSIKKLATAMAESCLSTFEQLSDFLELLELIEEIDSNAGSPDPQIYVDSLPPRPNSAVDEREAFNDMEFTKQNSVICPGCGKTNDDTTVLCMYCGSLLTIPAGEKPRVQRHSTLSDLSDRAHVESISLFTKLKWGVLYFILFSLLFTAYDHTDNKSSIQRKVLAVLKSGKDLLLRRMMNKPHEADMKSKSLPDDAATYLSQGDDYMKAGRVTEAADAYRAAAMLATNTTDKKMPPPPDNQTYDR